MGYTHYWRNAENLNPDKFATFAAEAKEIALQSMVPIQYEYNDTHHAVFKPDQIHFNGLGDDGHETFLITLDNHDFEFCKTAQKPYDLVVTAILCSLAYYFPEVKVTSDGDLEEWGPGIALYKKVTGRNLPSNVEL